VKCGAALNATLPGVWIGNAQQGVTHRVSIFRALQKKDFEHACGNLSGKVGQPGRM